MLRVRELVAKKAITKIDHPPYSPDFGSCEFSVFPKLKNALKGQRLTYIPDIKCNVTLLESITENDFQDCFRQWHRTIVSRSAYLHKERIS
jgi:hypothetical protein